MRSKLQIEGGTILEVEEKKGMVAMKPVPRLEAGKIVGEKEYKRLMRELSDLRSNG